MWINKNLMWESKSALYEKVYTSHFHNGKRYKNKSGDKSGDEEGTEAAEVRGGH